MTTPGGSPRSRHHPQSTGAVSGGAGSMVEKIRESYQKHSRNVSAVSDISVSLAEPLKRDENAEIRCVLLCDSEVERNCVFEAVGRALSDGQSAVGNVQLMQHHWEQPHVDCSGADCKYCTRLGPGAGFQATTSGSETRVSFLTPPTPPAAGSSPSPHDGYFRFALNGTVFRLMLLSKDRQNLLKIYSFDFLLVGMQVHGGSDQLLDQRIWEFEWKRLNRHSKKAVAPIVLLGYFRDILKLGPHGDGGGAVGIIKKVSDDARVETRKAGRVHHAIPRFVDFVDGSSKQLESLFDELALLYREPGFVLQQCAYVDNQTHFFKIAENPNLTERDMLWQCERTGDNPIMIAAKLRHKDLVSSVLRSQKFLNADGSHLLRNVIHARNNTGHTLLAMVALQGPALEEQKLLILQKEIQIHCESELTHEADQLKLQRCLRSQLKSSAEAATILDQSRALQGIPKTERELKAENGKVWSRLFFASLLLSLLFNAIDTGSDVLIMIRYYREMMGEVISGPGGNSTCGEEEMADPEEVRNLCNANGTADADHLYSIQCFPQALSAEQKFGYTLFFILVPWPFFIYEFFTSRQYQQLVNKGAELVGEMAACRSPASFCKAYLRAILYSVAFISCFLLWPIAVLFIKYYNDGKYYLAKGQAKAEREKKIEASEVLFSTARVMEVSLEASFQPTIQLYILLPVLVRTMTANYFQFKLFSICKDESLNFPMLKTDQTISIITSILSLAWCFTFYHATLKRGALDRDLAALFYRLVLFLSVLFQIIGRLFIFVLFAYSFGPGMYYPLLFFLAGHIVVMTMLHFIFSDSKMYWEKGGLLNLSFFHYMIGNGLANIYIHNWIRMDPLLIPFSKPLQHVSTLVRQLIFDVVLMAENVVLLAIALNSNIRELRENQISFACFLLGFSAVGLILKCVYYRYLHIWAWLIMDYITKKEDGHWMCILYSNMYLCGELKERRLTLCCVPRPIYNFFSWFCAERPAGSNCTVCNGLVTLFLLPIAVILALVALVVCLAMALAFMPFFVVGVLPCVVFVKCRRMRSAEPVVKIVESEESGASGEDFQAISEKLMGAAGPNGGSRHSSSNATTRQSSAVEGERASVGSMATEMSSKANGEISHKLEEEAAAAGEEEAVSRV